MRLISLIGKLYLLQDFDHPRGRQRDEGDQQRHDAHAEGLAQFFQPAFLSGGGQLFLEEQRK